MTGGLGLFGIIYSVKIRLVPRRKIRKRVKIVKIDELVSEFKKSVKSGALYGIFAYSADMNSDDYLNKGVLKTFEPVQTKREIPDIPGSMPADKWLHLRYLAHADKAKYFSEISEMSKETDGDIYWTDTHQLGTYIYNYHGQLDKMLDQEKATDVTTEIYVPPEKLGEFMDECRKYFKKNKTEIIFGGIGLIKEDSSSFLSYARRDFAKISFNIHTHHSEKGIKSSAEAFGFIIDQAIKHNGSYFLANHKFATAAQLKECFPAIKEFIALKKKYDPEERFQSDWYRHYKEAILSS